MRFFRTLFSGLLAIVAAKAEVPARIKNPAEMMRELRLAWLTRVPDKSAYESASDVIAVVMDWPLGENTVTVLSSSVGDASLYTTSTFGVLGGIGHEKVRNAAIAFVRKAQQHLTISQFTKEYPYPDSQTLQFYFVTPQGVRVVRFPMTTVKDSGSTAKEMFDLGQAVVTELRLITPSGKSG